MRRAASNVKPRARNRALHAPRAASPTRSRYRWLARTRLHPFVGDGRSHLFEDEVLERNRLPDAIRDIKYSIAVPLAPRQLALLRICCSLAYSLADIYGFQKEHPDVTDSERMVLSNVANQVEHIVGLLSNRMDVFEELPFIEALRKAVSELHAKVFENFTSWVEMVGLPQRVTQEGFISLGSIDVSLWEFHSSEEADKVLPRAHRAPAARSCSFRQCERIPALTSCSLLPFLSYSGSATRSFTA